MRKTKRKTFLRKAPRRHAQREKELDPDHLLCFALQQSIRMRVPCLPFFPLFFFVTQKGATAGAMEALAKTDAGKGIEGKISLIRCDEFVH